MRIGSIGVHFQPYIYNTNTVSANSLNKISGIEDDALKSSIDYNSEKNVNPLRPGETSNFMDVLSMQFQLSKNNAARVMKPVQDVATAVDTAKSDSVTSDESAGQMVEIDNSKNGNNTLFSMNKAIEAYTAALAV